MTMVFGLLSRRLSLTSTTSVGLEFAGSNPAETAEPFGVNTTR